MDLYFWPPNVPREETVDSFIVAFQGLGFTVCADESFEQGFEKVALFAKKGVPTHAARQLTNGSNAGRWTSKMGSGIDVAHALQAVCGKSYGQVTVVMKRPLGSGPPSHRGS